MITDSKMSPKILMALDVIFLLAAGSVYFAAGSVTTLSIEGPAKGFVDEYDDVVLKCISKCNNKTQCAFSWSGDINGTTVHNSTVSTWTAPRVARRRVVGKYNITCTVTDEGDTTTQSTQYFLSVYYPPAVSAMWDSNKKTLTCKAKGLPEQYTFKELNQVVGSTSIRSVNGTTNGDTLTYHFSPMSYQDRGVYTCLVSNGRPSPTHFSSGSVNVTLDEKPLLIPSQTSYNVSKGADLQMTLTIYAIPKVSEGDVTLTNNASESIPASSFNVTLKSTSVNVTFHGKQASVTGQRVTVMLRSVAESVFGNVAVTITNTAGQISTDITLYPEGAPDPPEEVRVTDVSHDQLTLTFRTGFFNGAAVTIVVEYRSTEETAEWVNGSSVFAGEEKNLSVTATIPGLSAETAYMFRAYGYNMYARSEYTGLVNVTTLEAPSQVALIVSATVGGLAFVVIVVVIAILVLRKRRKGTKKADQNEIHIDFAGDQMEGEIDSGKDNLMYSSNTETYENTKVKNGKAQTIEPTYGNAGNEEPIYMNNQNSRAEEIRKISGQNFDDPEKLIAMEGYLDLENTGKTMVEEAYATKDLANVEGAYASSNVTQLSGSHVEDAYATRNVANAEDEEEAYLDMEVVKPLATHKSSRRNFETPKYLNLSQQIGLIAQAKSDPGPNELCMNPTQSPRLSAGKRPMKSKPAHGAKNPTSESPYMSMVSKKPVAVHAQKKSTNQSEYLNLEEYRVFDNKTIVSEDQSPYVSMSAKRAQRESIPTYDAPPPPVAVVEEDYMNIEMGMKR